MINIVIPMAGAGSRFAKAGYVEPKPLIDVNGQPMIKLVIENLRPSGDHRFIFICQREHVEQYCLDKKLIDWAPNSEIICIEGLTDGAARTVLQAKDIIDKKAPLMIANSDQYVDIDINRYLSVMADKQLDGIIMTMRASDAKWSYVGLDENGLVTRVVEKEVISNEATVGIYNFGSGSDFIEAAEEMILQEKKVNNEYYVAPVYNELIGSGKKIGIYNIGKEGDGMYGLGIPADLDYFLKHPLSKVR